MTAPRILLADDHPIMIDGMKLAIPGAHEILGTFTDGRSLLDAALNLKPDLIVLDVSMPLLSGIEAARRIKANLPSVKIVFLTMHSERPYLQAALEAGADGYVLKSAVYDELRDAIQAVLAGQNYISSALRDLWSDLRGPDQIVKALELSTREREVLKLVAEGRSSKEIASILNISVKTVSFHRENIKRKLGIKTIAELTRNAIAGGFT